MNVRAYDAAEISLLQKLSCWSSIEAAIGASVTGKAQTIPTEQFLLCSMFRDLDCNGVEDLKKYVQDQERRLSRLVVAAGGLVNSKPGLQPTEHTAEATDFGIAFGLAVADLIFGTTEMDWKPIPVKKTKDYDYHGSNKKTHIELEVKGSFVDDISKTPSAISNHKASIKAKKGAKGPPHANTVCLGMIASVAGSGTPTVRVVDPPGEIQDRSPEDQQLLHRMDFLSRWISCISPRSSLAIALRGRFESLKRMVRIDELDDLPLVTGTGKRIDVSPYQIGQIHSRFFATRSVVSDGTAGGIICATEEGVFFLGLMENLLSVAVRQKFDEIRAYRRKPETVAKTVRCTIPKSRKPEFSGLQVDWKLVNQLYIRFEARGELHYTAGGLVFGWLKV